MEYRIVEREAFNVAGIRRITKDPGGSWGIVKQNGDMEKLLEASDGRATLGLCYGFYEDGSNDYMVGFETEDAEVPGFEVFRYPESRWLHIVAEGNISDGTLGRVWREVHSELMDSGAFKLRAVPTIEDYQLWDTEADACRVEIWVAIK